MQRAQIFIRAAISVAFLACFVSCRTPTAIQVEQLIAGQTMGTTYSVKLVPFSGMPSISKVSDVLNDELESVSRQMSTYDETSEISQFNAFAKDVWFPVSSETAEVVEASQKFSGLSGGVFDVTTAPLVDLWGFGPSGRIGELPSDTQIETVLNSVGFENLTVQRLPPALRKSVPSLRLDLSAIAKGHGVDRVAACLDALGFQAYFVEIGGEVVAKGTKVDGAAWRVGVEKPVEDERAIQVVLELNDCALATSGDYRNVYRIGDQRFSHTIDPSSGRPVKNSMASATVVASSCMEADAAATTLMAAGPEQGLLLAEELGWKAFLISRTSNGFEIACSSEFREQFPEVATSLSEMSR